VADYSRYSDSTLRQLRAECKEQYYSLHAKSIRLENQGQDNTPEYKRLRDEARRQRNVMIDIEGEGGRRGLILRH
jgi:hypothetical protein